MNNFFMKNKRQNFEESLNNIKEYYETLQEQNASLEEENQRLKSENYKDEELHKMQEEVEKIKKKMEATRKDSRRGFPISEEEARAIREWKEEHEKEVHGLTSTAMRMKASGCSGGRYTYRFVPTTIGTVGEVVCSCGASFTFQDLM